MKRNTLIASGGTSWEYDTCRRISTICTRRTKWPSIIITIRYLLRNLFLYFLIYIYIRSWTNINQIVRIVGSERLSVRESRGSRSGRGGATVLSRNSLLFQRHAADRPRQEEQPRVSGTRGMEKRKKAFRNFLIFFPKYSSHVRFTGRPAQVFTTIRVEWNETKGVAQANTATL